jgi:molybdopterin-guanine dinucleotide biosynthesis protein A
MGTMGKLTIGGIVLCGGRSRRMGRPKLALPFGPETMLGRVVRRLGEAAGPVVVVAAPGQALPTLAADVSVARDRRENRGPLEGLAVGLRAIGDRADAAFVTACDVPLLRPDFARRMAALLEDFDAAVPHIGGFDEPLAAIYRRGILPQVETLLKADRLRPTYLFDMVRTRRVADDELTDIDPDLDSLFNVNRPEDYQTALRRAGLGMTNDEIPNDEGMTKPE